MADEGSAGPDGTLPPHDVDACGRCQFINDGSSIFYTKKQEAVATIDVLKMLAIATRIRDAEDYIVELGWFTLPRQPDHAMWYLYQCPECLALSRSLISGYEPRLICGNCSHPWYVDQERFFRDAGLEKPTFLSALRGIIALCREYGTGRATRPNGGSRP